MSPSSFLSSDFSSFSLEESSFFSSSFCSSFLSSFLSSPFSSNLSSVSVSVAFFPSSFEEPNRLPSFLPSAANLLFWYYWNFFCENQLQHSHTKEVQLKKKIREKFPVTNFCGFFKFKDPFAKTEISGTKVLALHAKYKKYFKISPSDPILKINCYLKQSCNANKSQQATFSLNYFRRLLSNKI